MNSLNWPQFDKGVFLVNVLGIVYNPETRKILIGKRENDPYIKELSWTFPGGRPAYDNDLEYYLKQEMNPTPQQSCGVSGRVFYDKFRLRRYL